MVDMEFLSDSDNYRIGSNPVNRILWEDYNVGNYN